MKAASNHSLGITKWVWAITLHLLLVAAVFPVSGQIVTLSDQNSTVTLDLSPSAGNGGGMTGWRMGGVNTLAQEWFWYRIGTNGPEQAINSIGGLTFTQPDARTLYATYFNGQYGVTINYLLTGSPLGHDRSDISESILITNATASPLAFHFFEYANQDLGSPSGDTVQLGKNLRGLFNEADQSKSFGFAVTETLVTPGANRGEAGLYNSTLAKLSDGNTDDLNNNVGPLTGDATWAFQWDLTIPATNSVGISKEKYVVVPWPEPSAISLLSLGSVGFVLRKRLPLQAASLSC